MEKILIIEDEQAITTLLKEALIREGFTPITAKNGKVGVELAFKNHPSLILLDLIMP